jgi:16S rRNA (guanine966-N2)-methyltransferase
MRVIAGEARGRRLEALPGTDVTRPTLDQVKEAMFSIVQFDLPGARVLDLYAGSGQLGIEALSRGAARCVFLDENRDAVNIVMKNCKNCGVFDRSRVNIGEAARYLSACHEQFDLVLLDPPFRGGTLEKILPGVEKRVAPGGIVLCESETGLVLPAEVGSLTLKKQYKYGKVLLWKYTKPMAAEGETGGVEE